MLKFSFLITALIISSRLAEADTVDVAALPNHPPREFLFGADFDPNAPDESRALIYETGMNCLRITGGGFQWSLAARKKLADDFQARGLKVYMQLGSHYPDSTYFNLKDARMVDQDGKSGVEDKNAWAINYSGQCWPQYSYTSIAFREKLTKDFTAYVGSFSDNHNVAGVVLHNEPGFFWLSNRVFDYNPTAIEAFHKWLEQKHGTIAVLNKRWGTTYGSFAEVVPAGKPPVSNLAAWMDWRRFSVGTVADFMRWEADLFKTLRSDIPRTTNLDGPLNNWYGYRCANILEYSAPMDRVGMDIYPSPYTNRAIIPYSTDMAQGVAQGREADVMECDMFSPKGWKDYDEKGRAGLLSSEVWTMIGHGMDAIMLWGFSRADDVTMTEGTGTDRVRACRDIANACSMIGVKDFHRLRSRVAVCVDPDSYLHESGVEERPLELATQLDEEVQGFHSALADAGIQSDVILLDQLRSGVSKNYDAIILPVAMMMDEDCAVQLRSFVSGGGMLIASAPFSKMDRWAKPFSSIPAFGLDEVFGMTITAGGRPAGQDEIISVQGKIGAQEAVGGLVLSGAQAIGTFADGAPAIMVHSFGHGRAVFIAARVGQAYLENWGGKSLSAMLADCLQQASILPITAVQASVPLDTSSIMDRHGNVLLVLSVLGSKGKIPVPAENISAIYRCAAPASYRACFAFVPTRVEGGIVRSGPIAMALTSTGDGKGVSINLPEIDSTLPVLLVKEASPLLAVEAPQTIAQGQEAQLTVTCFNPSASAIHGKLELHAASSILPIEGDSAVEVSPDDQKKISVHFKARSDGPVVRLAVQAVLVQANPAREVAGIPVDIEIK